MLVSVFGIIFLPICSTTRFKISKHRESLVILYVLFLGNPMLQKYLGKNSETLFFNDSSMHL